MTNLIFFSVLTFSMIGLIIPSVSAEIYVHESDFPFSIQYPTGWEVFDEDEWGGVAIGDKTGRNGMYVGILCSEILGDDCGQAGADYQELDYLKQDSEYACEAVTMKEDYLTCRDLKFLEEFVHELDGYRAVTTLEEATILDSGKNPLFPDGKAGRYQDIGFVTYVLVGNDIWFIATSSEADKFDQELHEALISTFMINNVYAQEDIFYEPSWFESLINAIISLFSWNTDTSSEIIETGIDKVPFEEADDFFNDPNIDWDNPIIIDIDPCEYYEC